VFEPIELRRDLLNRGARFREESSTLCAHIVWQAQRNYLHHIVTVSKVL
jgi:hypothetical protein